MNELQIYIDRMFNRYKQTCATCQWRQGVYCFSLPWLDLRRDFPGEQYYSWQKGLCQEFLDKEE